MSEQAKIAFGKARGGPKKARRWVWKCDCDKCLQRPLNEVAVHGPFKTRRDAEKNAKQAIMLAGAEPQGEGTAMALGTVTPVTGWMRRR